jgi:hypothetical protein
VKHKIYFYDVKIAVMPFEKSIFIRMSVYPKMSSAEGSEESMKVLSCALFSFLVSCVILYSVDSSRQNRPLFSSRFKAKKMEITKETIICPTAPPAIGPYSHVR